jgi:hypothetical protein
MSNTIKQKPIGTPAVAPEPAVDKTKVATAKGAVATASAAVDSPKPPVKTGSGRPTSRRGTSTSIYFSKTENLEKLMSLSKDHPRASVSAIMNQLLDAFVKALDNPGITQNYVSLKDIQIFL